MKYELTALWRTLRHEGVGSLATKAGMYFSDVARAPALFVASKPEPTADEVVRFVFQSAGGLIAPTQVRSEFQALAQVVAELRPKAVLEIGTARGGTLMAWCGLAHPEATVISLDLPNGIHGGGYPYWKTMLYRRFARPKQRLHLLRGDSHSPLFKQEVEARLPERSLDFLFIDGDHTYEGVKSDFEMYGPLVRPGGVIAFHDICVHAAEMHCHVDRYWNEVKQGRRYSELIENPKQGNCGIGVLIV